LNLSPGRFEEHECKRERICWRSYRQLFRVKREFAIECHLLWTLKCVWYSCVI